MDCPGTDVFACSVRDRVPLAPQEDDDRGPRHQTGTPDGKARAVRLSRLTFLGLLVVPWPHAVSRTSAQVQPPRPAPAAAPRAVGDLQAALGSLLPKSNSRGAQMAAAAKDAKLAAKPPSKVAANPAERAAARGGRGREPSEMDLDLGRFNPPQLKAGVPQGNLAPLGPPPGVARSQGAPHPRGHARPLAPPQPSTNAARPKRRARNAEP